MAGLSPKLPMRRSFQDGYLMNQTLKEVIQQNLKGLLLTSPGERIMDPLFGVGLRDFLFEQNTPLTREALRDRIYEQVAKYMSFLKLSVVRIIPDETGHVINVSVEYYVPSLGKQARISVDVALKNSQVETI
jgi:phage baseplate assembly protein W